MYKGYLKLIVLKLLNEEELSGYDIINRTCERTGKKPSPGTIYPLLKDLHKSRFVKIRKEGKKKIYSITSSGKKKIKSIHMKREELIMNHVKLISELDPFIHKGNKDNTLKAIDKLKRDNELKFSIMPLWGELRETLINLILRSDFDRKKHKMRTIINRTIKELKEC